MSDQVTIGATGPKISSFTRCGVGETSVRTTGATKWPRRPEGRCGAVGDAGAGVDGGLDGRVMRAAWAARDDGADVGAGGGGPDAEALDGGAEARGEVGGDGLVDEEAVGGGAGLAAVAELGDQRTGDGGVEVGVRGDDEGGVAAELHGGDDDAVGGLAQQHAGRSGSSR